MHLPRLLPALCAAALLAAACGAAPDDPQLPPTTGAADVETWLAKGHHLAWHCEASIHAAQGSSVHGFVRVCSNDAIAASTGGGAYPAGAASVKELYASADGGTLLGHAVSVHVVAGSEPSSWYWYERNSSLSSVTSLGSPGLLADGRGPSEGPGGCSACHQLAGSDASHQTGNSHDFVFIRVP